MPGDEWQRFANLRILFGYMYTHPGTKLLFMGGEFGQTTEWNIEKGLEWGLLEYDYHKGVQTWVKELNKYYNTTTALYEKQFDPTGFEWIDHGDYERSLLTYLRRGEKEDDLVAIACNFTPVPVENYRMGVPAAGTWTEKLNSDDKQYGGSGNFNNGKKKTTEEEWNGRPHYIEFDLPPLSVVVFEKAESRKKKK
jgi:1,4-alpha-glucan branching enzyme